MIGYIGKTIPWNEFMEDFLDAYPGVDKELRPAAQALLATKLEGNFSNITMLEARACAVVEAYLGNRDLTQGKFDIRSKVPENNVLVLQTEDAEDGEEAAREAPSSSAKPTKKSTPAKTSTPVAPRERTIAPPAVYAIPETEGTPLVDLLHNFTMHIIACNETPEAVYKKVAKLGPSNRSTKLMTGIIKATKWYQASQNTAKPSMREPAPAIWELQDPRRRSKSPPRRTSNPSRKNESSKCYRCGKSGHFSKNCNLCAFCKAPDHTTKNCKRRIANAKGKYCRYCKISDSHSYEECRKRKMPNRRRGNIRNVRGNSEEEEANYDPTTFEDNTESDEWGH